MAEHETHHESTETTANKHVPVKKTADKLDKYKWYILGGLALLAGLVYFFVTRSNQNAATANNQAAQTADNGLNEPATPYGGGYYPGGMSGPRGQRGAPGPRGKTGGRGGRGKKGTPGSGSVLKTITVPINETFGQFAHSRNWSVSTIAKEEQLYGYKSGTRLRKGQQIVRSVG